MKKTILTICIVAGILLTGIIATSLSVHEASELKNLLVNNAGDETGYLLVAIFIDGTPFPPPTWGIEVYDENDVLVEPTHSGPDLAVNIYY